MSNTRPSASAFRVVAIRQPSAFFEPQFWRPSLNIYETELGLQVVAELAGASLEDIQVLVQPAKVVIQGTRRLGTPDGLARIHRLEIAGGPFKVEMPLSAPVDPEQTQAQYTDGLLVIWLPFARQTVQRVVVIQPVQGGAR